MGKAGTFCYAIGLTFEVQRWLRQNPGDPLREDVIRALMDAFHENCPASHESTLRFLVIQVNRRIDPAY